MPELDLVRLLRWSHVAVGVAGLLLFWIPICTKKGSRLHVKGGRLFACCAVFGGATGLFFSCWAIIDPASFLADRGPPPAEPRTFAVVVAHARFLHSITGFLALGVLAGTVMGIRIVQARADHARLRGPIVMTLLGAFGTWSAALLLFGLWSVFMGEGAFELSGPREASRYWVSVVLGSVGVWGACGDLKYVTRPPATAHAWRYQHMECMLGVGIGFHSAAFFFIAKALLPAPLSGAWSLAPMLVPLVVGTPLMWIWIAREERRLTASPPPGDEAHDRSNPA